MLSRQAQFWSASLLTCFHVSRAHWELLSGKCISGFLEHVCSLSESFGEMLATCSVLSFLVFSLGILFGFPSVCF